MASSQSPLQRLRELIAVERDDVHTLIIYGIAIGLMSLATPIAVQALVNTIAFGALLQPLAVLTLILLVLMLLGNSLAALQFYVVEMLQRRLFVRHFGLAAQQLAHARFELHDSRHLPELANRFFDVVTLQKTAAVMLLETLGYLLQTLIGMILLAFYHPMLLAFDLFMVAMLAFILFVLGKEGVKTAIEQSKAKYEAAAWLETIATHPLLTRNAAGERFFHERSERLATDYLNACQRHFRILNRQNIAALSLHAVANTLLLGMGGWMVIERQLSLGQLIAAELVVSAMIYGLTRLGKTLDNFYELLTSLDKIGHLQDLPQEIGNDEAILEISEPYRVDIHHLSVARLPTLDRLDDIDLHLTPGEHLLIGTGAERGTLLDCLFGLRTPLSGRIEIDGHDLRELNLLRLRDRIALVREAEIIEAGILDNLKLGWNADNQQCRKALATVELLDFVLSLPDGLNTRLAANGAPLNQEQALRLTLARAVCRQPKLLLLDRVPDCIDRRALPGILHSLTSEQAPWTLVVVSQEPAVADFCRRRIEIRNGRVMALPAQPDNGAAS
ncbi:MULTISPECIES: ATP-binding cassette domain-containing protein [Methylomonas]|uniref:ATP-binding cassette domain-containing protein n=1 Tax=Methylomonas TaxID=416 RepID=UPI001232413F|nr:ABC transporter ATP-binding protein [Methylomonas rhizoryzae]